MIVLPATTYQSLVQAFKQSHKNPFIRYQRKLEKILKQVLESKQLTNEQKKDRAIRIIQKLKSLTSAPYEKQVENAIGLEATPGAPEVKEATKEVDDDEHFLSEKVESPLDLSRESEKFLDADEVLQQTPVPPDQTVGEYLRDFSAANKTKALYLMDVLGETPGISVNRENRLVRIDKKEIEETLVDVLRNLIEPKQKEISEGMAKLLRKLAEEGSLGASSIRNKTMREYYETLKESKTLLAKQKENIEDIKEKHQEPESFSIESLRWESLPALRRTARQRKVPERYE